MNLCVLSGIINNKIDLQFIYYLDHKKKKEISIAEIELLVQENTKKEIIKLIAYDEIADWIYQNIKKGDYIAIEGELKNNKIIIKNYYI